MADVSLGTSTHFGFSGTFRPLIWASDTVGYFFRIHQTNGDLVYTKTTDGGATWGSDVTVKASTLIRKFNCWASWWTTGDTGTLINITYMTGGTLEYRNLNVANDALSTAINVKSLAGSGGGHLYSTHAIVDITKARGGNLYIAYNNQDVVSTTEGLARSTDGGVNWTDRATPFESSVADRIILQPGDAADNNDILAIFWDKSSSELDRKLYDNSANSWSTTNIDTSIVENFNQVHMVAVTYRKSDNHSMVLVQNNITTSTEDLKCYDIASGSITAKTDVWTNEANHMAAGLVIDQNNDDLYALFIGDPCEDDFTAVNVYSSKSTDGGGTWATKVQINEACADDFREVYVDPSVGDVRAGLIGVAFARELTTTSDFFFSAVNAITITGGAVATPPFGPVLHQQLAFLLN